MARNMVQFQKGLSEPAFEHQYGTPLCQTSCRLDRIKTPGGAEGRTWHDTDRSSKTRR